MGRAPGSYTEITAAFHDVDSRDAWHSVHPWKTVWDPSRWYRTRVPFGAESTETSASQIPRVEESAAWVNHVQ
jgi:hypothetical protein